ncbi:DUF7344 domain-containing protein [Natronorubrum texcoconense]|uniref:DUF7344 domain-containing protein n=1 Tax=Natronorubrum texcoconense TaxID=1095776 RepID=A0A1G8YLD8_9EURY|nr:hypothetical protein [Natronorubrum texcoconense]SDK03581.1 hypothetical protein SAMN04515672_2211 [Natronorubrum texcoconense]
MTNHSPRNRAVQRERASLDELFDVLSKPPRRRILTALADANPRDEVEFAPRDFTSDEQREDALVRLHHAHLPKLDEAGFIEWNRGSKTITRGPRFDEIAPLIELITTHRDELPVRWL